jgi:hypothetical protein
MKSLSAAKQSMTRRDWMSVLASTSVAAFGASCGQTGARQRPSDLADTSKWEGPAYENALKKASEHSQDDRLRSLLTSVSTSRLAGHPLGDVSQFTVGPNGNLYVLDDSAGVVSAFTNAGKFLSSVGRRGMEPGQYTVATDVAALPNGDIAVSDFKQSRIHIFDPNFGFARSVLTTKQKFSSSAVTFAKSEQTYYLVGSRYIGTQADHKLLKVHAYQGDGAFLRSTLPFPRLPGLENMERHTSMALEKSASAAPLLAYPFDYRIYELRDGEASVLSGISGPQDFRPPQEALGQVLGPTAMQVYRNWTLSWTPINYVGRCSDQILVQRQVFAPLRYVIDVFSSQSKKLLFQVPTNHRLLGHDESGEVYFLTHRSMVPQNTYDVIRGQWSRIDG